MVTEHRMRLQSPVGLQGAGSVLLGLGVCGRVRVVPGAGPSAPTMTVRKGRPWRREPWIGSQGVAALLLPGPPCVRQVLD